jgi:DNA replication protein DnaC
MSKPADSSLERIRRHLVGLKMPCALEYLPDTVQRIERGELSTLEAIEALLGEELTTRQSRRIKMALQTARLTSIKTLAAYDFSFQPSLDRQQILALGELDFVPRHQALHLLGPPGTGKTHLAIALGVEAVKVGHSVHFSSLADLIASLSRAEREHTLRERVRYLSRHRLLIVDEIGYLPVASSGGNLFFQLVNACYEKTAMILTSNRGFADWGEIFGDAVVATALLDRLLHHAIVIQIEGSSYRLREHAQLLPEHMRSRSTPANPVEQAAKPRRARRKERA